MTLCPTNMFRRIGQEFAYSIDTQLDADSLRRALNRVAISRGLRCSDAGAVRLGDTEDAKPCCNFDSSEAPGGGSWTLVLPLGADFQPDDVAVRLDSLGVFTVLAETASPWQDGDFVRFVRRAQLPLDQLDTDTARCWIEETCLVLQVDRRPVEKAVSAPPTSSRKHVLLHHHQLEARESRSLRNAWPRSSLSDSKQRQGCVTKEKRSGTKWSLDLALPEFKPDEVSVTTIDKVEEGADAATRRLLVTAAYFAADGSSLDSTMRHDYRREVTLPTGVPIDQVVASFASDGMLRLVAPVPPGAVKARRTIVGLVGGSAGGAGAKIASLTRELRHVGTQRRQHQQQAAGTSASLPRQPADAAASTSADSAPAAAAVASDGRSTTRSGGENRSCAMQ